MASVQCIPKPSSLKQLQTRPFRFYSFAIMSALADLKNELLELAEQKAKYEKNMIKIKARIVECKKAITKAEKTIARKKYGRKGEMASKSTPPTTYDAALSTDPIHIYPPLMPAFQERQGHLITCLSCIMMDTHEFHGPKHTYDASCRWYMVTSGSGSSSE